MSKSLGNVLDPFALVEQYGVDYVRYFLASEIHFGNDGDFSHESFAIKINTELANDFGNLVMRVLVLIHKFCDGKIPAPDAPLTAEDDALLLNAKQHTLAIIKEQLQELNIKSVVDAIATLPKEGNRYINQQAPWELAKSNPARMRTVLYVLMEVLRVTTIYLEPIVPTTATRLFRELGVPVSHQSFDSIESTMIPTDVSITPKPTPIFPRIEVESTAAESTQEKATKPTKIEKSKANSVKNSEENKANEALKAKYENIQNNIDGLSEEIVRVGNEIRVRKTQKASKDELAPLIGELKYLKDT